MAARENPDLILLDVKLPDMSGLDVCQQIKQERPRTLVLQVSASFIGLSDRVRGLKNGADSYLTEPAEPEELLAAIGALLRIRRAEDAARAGERQWQSTFDVIADGVCLVDNKGSILRANAALHRLSPGRSIGLVGHKAAALWPELFAVPAGEATVFAIGQRWVLGRADRLPETDELGGGMVCVFTDISERYLAEQQLERLNRTLEARVAERTAELAEAADRLRDEMAHRERAESALRQAQKMEAIGQLTGGVAHDFNNLLTGVLSNLELVKRHLGDADENVLRFAKAAMDGAARGAALTQRLLAFSRQQTLEPRAVDLGQTVQAVADLARRTVGENIRLEVAAQAGLNAWCDLNQLENALLNLIVNARDAMPQGGRVTLSTGAAELDSRVGEAAPGRYVTIAVSDTGTGMAPDVAERAFDPFFTTKPVGQGTGLGLSQVYGFAVQSGGHVQMQSRLGEGTTVCLYLPRHVGTTVERPAEPEPAAQPTGGQKLLVVEDDAIVRLALVQTLLDLGYEVTEAPGGPKALALLKEGGRVDLLITDVGLPGMSGRELAEAARELRPTLKTLFITGYAEGSPQRGGELGSREFVLPKPFTTAKLSARVAQVLDA
jgi:signal transduction histidine kinase